MCSASRTGNVRSPVIAHFREYTSVTITRMHPVGLAVAGLVELAEAAASNRSGGFQPKRAAPDSQQTSCF
jgi:hypothetical protein